MAIVAGGKDVHAAMWAFFVALYAFAGYTGRMTKNFGNFAGGNMQAMMKQAQEMQKQMDQAKEQLAQTSIEATSGGGMVRVDISGNYELLDLRINPEAVDPDDVEMLEDLVIAAINEALSQVTALRAERLPI